MADARLALAERARGDRTGTLEHDLALFVRLLRRAGGGPGPLAALTALSALRFVGVGDRGDFRTALRATVTRSPADIALFDLLFDVFWTADAAVPVATAAAEPQDDAGGESSGQSGTGSAEDHSSPQDRQAAPAGAVRALHSRTRGASAGAVAAPAAEVDAAARRLARALGRRRGRRWRTTGEGPTLDLRATLRANVSLGEELLDLRHRQRRRDRVRLLVLCDVSSSMKPVTPLFLSFTHALTRVAPDVEAAIFNVEPLLVTDVFRRSDRRRAMAWLGRQQGVLEGGTRIGHCIAGVLDQARVGGSPADTVALVLSDGWDVGERDLLRAQLRRLKTVAATLVWLDPHAERTGYHPQVEGMRTALEFCDHYLDFSSAASLTSLATTVLAARHAPSTRSAA